MMAPKAPPKIWASAIMMVAAWLAAYLLTPRELSPLAGDGFDLETIIPLEFAEWKFDPRIKLVQAVESDSLVDKIYDQTIYRGYRNSRGELIMLVVAYGRNQSDTLQVHLPEVCYTANGFEVTRLGLQSLVVPGPAAIEIPIIRLETKSMRRHEPISYWVRVGDALPVNNFSRQFEKISYGLTGKIPDGILIRVSSITRNSEAAFQNHETFIKQLLSAIPVEFLPAFVGSQGS